mgnify:FL=1|tara:strand:+ start:223 stop:639 length:417 start_codon:yes stop_codon:yes gene_type:complete
MSTKKDLNYVASVEKAIAEKYGKDTVQDFRNQWEEDKESEYLKQLKDLRCKTDKLSATKEETVVDDIRITKRRTKQKQDRTCPVCKTYSFSRKDDLYMNRFKCCYDCYVDFVEYREETWQNGERPTDEHIEYALRRRK